MKFSNIYFKYFLHSLLFKLTVCIFYLTLFWDRKSDPLHKNVTLIVLVGFEGQVSTSGLVEYSPLLKLHTLIIHGYKQ